MFTRRTQPPAPAVPTDRLNVRYTRLDDQPGARPTAALREPTDDLAAVLDLVYALRRMPHIASAWVTQAI
jgi:hypothetical protein